MQASFEQLASTKLHQLQTHQFQTINQQANFQSSQPFEAPFLPVNGCLKKPFTGFRGL